MRHAKRPGSLSRRSEHNQATLDAMAQNILRHGRIHTTFVKAKRAQPVVDRLITLGKEGSIHSRRQAFRVLQDRGLVKLLFAEIAPRYLDCRGGYTRVLRLNNRLGDGAMTAMFELTRLPAEAPKAAPKAQAEKATKPGQPAAKPEAKPEEQPQKPKKFFEGLRDLFGKKKGGAES